MIRIGKFLSHVGVCSRRNADIFLKENKIYFDSERIVDLNFRIPEDYLHLPVVINNRDYYWNASTEIILLNKPINYACSHRSFRNQESIMTLLPPSKHLLYYAGRLDIQSRGLVVLSNQGDIIHRLTHPSFNVKKIYVVQLDVPLKPTDLNRMTKGIYDLGEWLIFKSIRQLSDPTKYEVILTEGKNREIRRVMERFDREVIDLQRIQVGEYKLNPKLKEGEYETIDTKSKKINYLILLTF